MRSPHFIEIKRRGDCIKVECGGENTRDGSQEPAHGGLFYCLLENDGINLAYIRYLMESACLCVYVNSCHLITSNMEGRALEVQDSSGPN